MNPWLWFSIGIILILIGIFVPLPAYSTQIPTNTFVTILGFFLWTPLLMMRKPKL